MAEIELIDREKQRQEKENTPEGRQNKKIRRCLGIAAAVGIAMSELTYEKLVSSYGGPLSKEESTYLNGTEVNWEKNGYYFKMHVGTDEKIHYVQSSYGRR